MSVHSCTPETGLLVFNEEFLSVTTFRIKQHTELSFECLVVNVCESDCGAQKCILLEFASVFRPSREHFVYDCAPPYAAYEQICSPAKRFLHDKPCFHTLKGFRLHTTLQVVLINGMLVRVAAKSPGLPYVLAMHEPFLLEREGL